MQRPSTRIFHQTEVDVSRVLRVDQLTEILIGQPT